MTPKQASALRPDGLLTRVKTMFFTAHWWTLGSDK